MTTTTNTFKVRSLGASRHDPERPELFEKDGLPFEATLSLDPLIAFWRRTVEAQQQAPLHALLEQVERTVEENPALSGTIDDLRVLDGYHAFLDLLMIPVFSPAFRHRELAAALVPFSSQAFYVTPSFEWFLTREEGTMRGQVNIDSRAFSYSKTISAYLHVLRDVYELDVAFDYPIIFTAPDPATGLDRHYKITWDHRFLDVQPTGEAPALTKASMKRLLADLSDFNQWTRLLPPDAFRFSGFDILRAIDVTDHEVLSMLKFDLLEGESLASEKTFPVLEQRLRTLLRQPEVYLGLAALEDGHLRLVNSPPALDGECFFTRTDPQAREALHDSLFGKVLSQRKIKLIEDLQGYDERTELGDELLAAGVRSVVAAPLHSQGKDLGVVYLWAREPGTFDALNTMKLHEVLPLFSIAVRRGEEELHNRLQSVILSEYTAVHPAVEWRFRQAARNYLRRREQGGPAFVEPIIFRDVYPLYGASDIRSSSTHRNQAVRDDLVEHLALARAALEAMRQQQPLPILDYLLNRMKRFEESLAGGLTSGDEVNVRDFLKQEIEPVFEHLETPTEAVSQRIDAYRSAIDAQRGFLYRRCRDYDESLERINRTISAYLDAEERKAQRVFPHYFEKRHTDGVEFNIFVGASLVEDGDFHPLYLKNLRLWQLKVMCGIVRRVEAIKDDLAVPMETTHLILTQSFPLAISFRFDETRFDVEGAHHVRFEIMKQRVEKASRKDTEERLTQPGQIAIIYAQPRDALEYEEYIEFLQETGFLEDEIERVELDDLPGVQGLKALLVTVALEPDPARDAEASETVDRAVFTKPEPVT